MPLDPFVGRDLPVFETRVRSPAEYAADQVIVAVSPSDSFWSLKVVPTLKLYAGNAFNHTDEIIDRDHLVASDVQWLGDLAVSQHADSMDAVIDVREAASLETGESGTIMVGVGRLADFVCAGELRPPALLKLDVQGYELEALKGCEDLLASFSYVYAEGSFVELYRGQVLADELIAWLRRREFRLSGVYGVVYDGQGRAVQADMLFRKVAFDMGATTGQHVAGRGKGR